MCADIFTKAFTDPSKWERACWLINTIDINKLHQMMKSLQNVQEGKDVPATSQKNIEYDDSAPSIGEVLEFNATATEELSPLVVTSLPAQSWTPRPDAEFLGGHERAK